MTRQVLIHPCARVVCYRLRSVRLVSTLAALLLLCCLGSYAPSLESAGDDTSDSRHQHNSVHFHQGGPPVRVEGNDRQTLERSSGEQKLVQPEQQGAVLDSPSRNENPSIRLKNNEDPSVLKNTKLESESGVSKKKAQHASLVSHRAAGAPDTRPTSVGGEPDSVIHRSKHKKLNPLPEHGKVSQRTSVPVDEGSDAPSSSSNTSTSLPFDKSRRAWSPWREDPQCRRYTVHFTRGAPPRALASYPGSGNTWARYLIEAASGLHTGSVYSDDQLYLNGYRGELEPWRGGTTLLQKIHEYGQQHVAGFGGRGVLLLRNPYRAVLSFHNFLFGGHRGYAPLANYRRGDWEVFLHLQIKSWLLTAISWLNEATQLQVLHYEELAADPGPPLRGLLAALGQRGSEGRIACIKKHMSGKFLRRKEYLPHNLKVFSAAIRGKMDRAIRYVDYLLEKKRLPRLPLHLYEFYNGTLSNKIVRVPCPEGSTEKECDYLVDRMNKQRWFSSNPAPPTTRPPAGGNSPPSSHHGQGGPPADGDEAGEEAPTSGGEDTSLSGFERLSQSTLGSHLTEMFVDLILQFTPDPITSLIRSTDAREFMARPVHFDGDHGLQETSQLARDYSWRPPVADDSSRAVSS